MKKMFVIFTVLILFITCNKENQEQTQTNKTSGDTNRWMTVWQDQSYYLSSIAFLNKDTGYVAAYKDSTQKQQILATYDGGKTWLITTCNLGYDSAIIINLKAGNENTLYAFATNHGSSRIYKSTDGGIYWNIFSNTYNNYKNDFAIIDDRNIVLTVWEGVSKTSDGGITWQYDTVLINHHIHLPVFISGNTGFVIAQDNYGNGMLFRTNDGCKTWQLVNSGLKSYPFQMQFVSENTGFYFSLSENNILYKTSDSGIRWKILNQSLSKYTMEIYFIDENIAYYYDHYKIYHSIDGGTTWKIDYTLTGQPIYVGLTGWSFVKSGEAFAITEGGRIIKKMY